MIAPERRSCATRSMDGEQTMVCAQSTEVGVEGDSAGDPIARPLFLTRLVCVAVWLIPIALAALMPFFGFGWRLALNDGGSLLVVFALLALFDMAGAVLISVFSPRLASTPIALGVLSAVSTAIANVAALLGFIASITYESLLPFAVGLAFTAACWAIVWPRRSVWRKRFATRQS